MERPSVWDKIWKDKEGKVVIGQFPNTPLWLFIVAYAISAIGLDEDITRFAKLISLAFLSIWSYWEVTDGVNYFRRFLGVLGVVYILNSFWNI